MIAVGRNQCEKSPNSGCLYDVACMGADAPAAGAVMDVSLMQQNDP